MDRFFLNLFHFQQGLRFIESPVRAILRTLISAQAIQYD